ncbi:MAG: FAD-binding protein [Candidatus Dadabacteria bacterium]|nr:FAD-binding protein [Candidatus Dadabacteria bacterium]NIS08540.1 FAD-binding protein [Candidatus Dadabacteria bacterium]NIV41368.1 FAD-binding protein [Candidatus Dadabacteria bacterium]NIX14575.1 FAD-binding protein [Candidatus Dadabacteria bacterium]NIY21030.1 FAD-binding protein [Candidatus Dadabacteria bacterium]
MDKDKFILDLEGMCGKEYTISSHSELVAFECDGLTGYRVKPFCVVLPATTGEVSEVIKLCYENDVPFVPRGSGTGLSGGALPVDDGIVISLSRMTNILDVDIENQRVVVEPGVINLQVTKAVENWGYYYAPDPSSQVVCSIGGNVAENSGGVHCLKYGVTSNHVLGLEAVLPTGEVVELGGKTLDPPGYDLVGLFVGSEGLLGIVTKITLKIIKKPQTIKTMFASFGNIAEAGASVSGIISKGIIPGGMEIMDNISIMAVESVVNSGYPVDAAGVLIVELDGLTAEVEAQTPLVIEVLKENKAEIIKIAKDMAERDLFWKGRKSAFAAMGRMSPEYYVQDGVIPRSKLAGVLAEIEELSKKYGIRVANVFHAGDGNLHPLILYDTKIEGQLEKAEQIAGDILEICVNAGGSITGEHGVGFDKKRFLDKMFSEDDLDTMNMIRCTFDHKNLCNPGKVFPTPRTCVEPGMKKFTPHELHEKAVAEMY